MVSSTRSAKRNKDKLVGDSSKKKVVNRKIQSNLSSEKADVLGLRRSARETHSSRLKIPSPQRTRKSERIEKQTPVPPSAPTMTAVKSKKHDPRSPLRMLDRGKTATTSSSSGSKQSGKQHSPLNVKKKEIKEKRMKKLNVESGKDELDTDSIGTKRKKMDARSYKALFKPQKKRSSAPDVAEELLRQDKQPQVNSREISSKPIGKSNDCSKRIIEKLADESASRTSAVDISEKESEGKLVKSSLVHGGNEDPPQPSAGDGSRNLMIGSTSIDLLDDSERAPENCSSFKDVEFKDGSANDVECIQPKVTRCIDSNLDLSPMQATSAMDISENVRKGKLLNSSPVHSGNEDSPQPSGGDGSRNLMTDSTIMDKLDVLERAPKNCSSFKNAEFKDSLENDVQCIQPKGTRRIDSDLDLSSMHATSAMDISEKESEDKLLKSGSAHSGNEDPPPQPSGGDGSRNIMTGSTIIDLLDDSERAPKNCSSFENAKFKDGSENDVQCMQAKGSVPLSSPGSDIRDLLDNCIKCFKKKSIPELSKFVEYWVPVPLSNCQLEQYCATLLSNSIPLCSCSKSDPIGALRDILFTVRKCCDHPYLVNPSIQESLIAKGCLAQLLDTGIKVCGKLQLLDMILSELKNQGQQVLILYQTIVGGGASIGDILDDFLRQRFGTNSYERIDSRVAPVKKQAVVNRFNRKETGQFVFLLENRACSSSIKLSSVNIVVIYDSEWNPANDLRALQKICFDSKLERIKVFRLYSSCTVEEKALLLAKQVLNLDNNLQNLSRTTSDTLLVWGASYLFSKLDDYHADSNPPSASNISSEQLLLHDTTKELLSILSGSCENNDSGCIISKAQLGVGRYSINLPLLGEGKFQLKDGEEAHVFWRKLLEGRNPPWKYSRGSTPRNRKRVKYFDGDSESVEVGKKRRKVGSESVDLASVQVEPKGHQINPAASSKGGPSTAITNQSQSLEKSTCLRTDNISPENNFISGQRSSNPGDVDKPQDIVALSNEQKSLHIMLKREMARLCQILEVSEDVVHIVERFLEYVIKNHHVSNESPTIIQAFQMSLFWIAASLLKRKIDKKDSLMTAKKSLNYGCTEEQANHVYSKMRLLKKMFLQCPENSRESRKDWCDAGISQNLESGTDGQANKEPFTDLMVAECETEDKLKKIQKKCDKRMKKLIQKQQQELQKFHRTWDEERDQLEKEHKLESACIRSIHGQGSVATDKLKLLDSEFSNKMEEHKRLKEMHMKELEANQLAAKNAEREKAARWLAKAKACHTELKSVDKPLGSQSDDKVGCSDARAHITVSGHENAVPLIEQQTECTNLKEGLCVAQRNDVPSNTHVITQAEAVGCTAPTETANNLASEEVASEVPEVVPEGVDHAQSVEQSDVSNKKCNKGDGTDSNMSDDVNQRNGNESANGCLHSPAQTLLPRAEAVASPDHLGSLTLSQVQLEGSVSGEFQSGDAPVPQDKSSSQVEVTTSEGSESDPSPQSNHATVVENRELQQPVAIDASLSCDQTPGSEVERGINECERILVPETSSQLSGEQVENRELQQPVAIDASLGCDQTPGSEVERGINDSERILAPETCLLSGEQEASQHQVISQSRQAQLPNQLNLQSEVDVAHASGSQNVTFQHHYQVPTWYPAPSSNAEPLQNELLRVSKEAEKELKVHEDLKKLLQSECEKEIQERISQIRDKYDAKLHDAETAFQLKKNELDKYHNKVLMNRILAEAFRSKCMPSGPPGLRQAMSPIFMQLPVPHQTGATGHQAASSVGQPQTSVPTVQSSQQLTLSHSTIPAAIVVSSSTCQPRASSPTVQAAHQPSLPHSTGPTTAYVSSSGTQPAASQHHPTPAVQTVHQTSALFSGVPSRPPLISTITPSMGNLHIAEVRSPAPHLRPFRPSSTPSASSHGMPNQQTPPFRTAISPSLSQFTPQRMPHSQVPSMIPISSNTAQLESRLPGPHNVSQSAVQLLMDMDQRPRLHNPFASLPDLGATFGSLEQSDLETLGNVQGSLPSSAVTTNVVYLSDDD